MLGFTLLKKVVTFKRLLTVEFGLCYRCRLSSYISNVGWAMVVLLSYYSKRSSRLTNFSVCFRAVPSDFRKHWIAFLVRFSGDPSSSTSSVLRVKKCALDGLRLTSRIA